MFKKVLSTLFLLPSEKGVLFLPISLLPFFPDRADPFSERDWCTGKQTESHKSCPCQNGGNFTMYTTNFRIHKTFYFTIPHKLTGANLLVLHDRHLMSFLSIIYAKEEMILRFE